MLPALIDSTVIPEVVIQMSEAPFKIWSANHQQPLEMQIQIATVCLADAKRCAAFFHQLQISTSWSSSFQVVLTLYFVRFKYPLTMYQTLQVK